MKIFNSPVYPIPPSFDNQEELDLESTERYIHFLTNEGAKILMTTAGTSQFNLMSLRELRKLNELVGKGEYTKILGLPAISYHDLKDELEYLNKQNYENCSVIVIFPERYYNDEQVYGFFKKVCEISNYPILAHGNPIQRGNGGVKDYDNILLKKLSTLEKFIGIKEESSSLEFASKNLKDLDLEIIVAGGSMKRFWFLQPFGATTYLTGVGSFNPRIEEDFYSNFSNQKFQESKTIMENYETPLFETFMSVGWHASMRESLIEMGYIKFNRCPFVEISIEDKEKIKLQLKQILI